MISLKNVSMISLALIDLARALKGSGSSNKAKVAPSDETGYASRHPRFCLCLYSNSWFVQGQEVMAKSRLRIVAPSTEKRTVTPKRRPNADLRTREYLTDRESRCSRRQQDQPLGHRDATMILVAYRHGLRASELVDLRWDQIDFDTATLAVRRAKKGTPSTHPIRGDELRRLRRLQHEQEPKSPFVFTSERGAPFSTAGFARMVERAGVAAELGFKAASPCHGRRAGQQGARYVGPAGLPGPQEYSAHGALHRAVSRSVQGLLALIT